MRLLEKNLSLFRFLLFSFESLLILGILCLASFVEFLYLHGLDFYTYFDAARPLLTGLIFAGVCQLCMYLNELYDFRSWRDVRELMIRLGQALGIACILLSLIYILFKGIAFGKIALYVALPTLVLSLVASRVLYRSLISSENLRERVLLLGSSETAHSIIEELAHAHNSWVQVVAIVLDNGAADRILEHELRGVEVIRLEDFPKRVASLDLDRIVVTLTDRRGKLPFDVLVDCRFKGIQVEEATSFYEKLKGKVYLADLRPSYFIFTGGFRWTKFTLRVKRIIDVVMAVLLLILASPVMLLTAALIKLTSRGPLIYKQDRVGQAWKDFTMYKFRSMVRNAEPNGAAWAARNDPRVTWVGRIIRRRRIDELPQLFNILKGDMSFVGPRPERRVFAENLAREIPYYTQRLLVKPGLTGWAQIKYHYGASRNETMEKLQYDLYYIEHLSIFFDLSIFIDTIRVVLSGAGGR
jgi:sugar transferase (PEP-CTERM system associated)